MMPEVPPRRSTRDRPPKGSYPASPSPSSRLTNTALKPSARKVHRKTKRRPTADNAERKLKRARTDQLSVVVKDSEAGEYEIQGGKGGPTLLKLGSFYWSQGENKDSEIVRLDKVNISEGELHESTLTLRIFFPEKSAAREAHTEYYLDHSPKTWSLVQGKELRDKAAMLPMEKFARSSHEIRSRQLVCRFIKNRELGVPENCCDDDFNPILGKPANDWLVCGCGCEKHVDLDQGWTYCFSCRRTMLDECIVQPSESHYLCERIEGEERVIRRCSKAKQKESAVASCPGIDCNAPYKVKIPSGPAKSTRFGHDTSKRSHIEIALDIGTDQCRIAYRIHLESNNPAGPGSRMLQFASRILVPYRPTNITSVQMDYTANASAEHDVVVEPIKALLIKNKFDPQLAKLYANFTAFDLFIHALREMLNEFIKTRVDPELLVNCDWTGDTKFLVAAAFPAAFDPSQRSAFLTGVHLALPEARIVAMPEPVAVYYNATKREKRRFGNHLIFDIGATTFDLAWIHCEQDGTIKVVCDHGFDALGAKVPYINTRDSLHKSVSKDARPAVDLILSQHEKELRSHEATGQEGTPESQDNELQTAEDKLCVGKFRQKDIESAYADMRSQYLDSVQAALKDALNDICAKDTLRVKESCADVKAPSTQDIESVYLFGGGAECRPLRKVIEKVLRERAYKGEVKPWPYDRMGGAVVGGLEKMLNEMNTYPTTYSPVTLCLEQQTHPALRTRELDGPVANRSPTVPLTAQDATGESQNLPNMDHADPSDASTGVTADLSAPHDASVLDYKSELIVLVLKDQALHGPKLFHAQCRPNELIYFETDLEPGEDSVLTFKALFDIPQLYVSSSRFLAAKPTPDFYTCVELRIKSKHWTGKRKAFTTLEVAVDMEGGVITCSGVLYSRKKWNGAKVTPELQSVFIEEELEKMHGMGGLKDVENFVKEGCEVLTKFNLAGSLNLNESNRWLSRFRT